MKTTPNKLKSDNIMSYRYKFYLCIKPDQKTWFNIYNLSLDISIILQGLIPNT